MQVQIIEYFSSYRQEYWLEQIGKSDWSAGQELYELLREDKFRDRSGETSKVLMLVDEDELISFCIYAEMDDIQPTMLTPWVGFVYTFPEYRGHHYFGKLLQEAERLARAENVRELYISTGHVGLYEKYGCEFYQMSHDVNGKPSRVYRKRVN